MTNFIFKSQGTYKKLCQQLEIIQSELRHQRADNAYIMRQLNMLVTDKNLKNQVDKFFDGETNEYRDETSPQTDSEETPEMSSSDMD